METASISQSNSMTPSLNTDNSVECNEGTLVAAAKGGSLIAFEQLVERYQERVFRVARTLAQSREDAEEIAQDAFAQAFKNLSQFRGDSRFYTWLVRITINEGLMKLRRRRANVVSIDDHFETEEGIVPGELEDGGPTPERWYLQQELREILTTSIGQLPRGQRSVFELREVKGCSTKETAHALDLSLSAVKSRLRRSRLQLRQSLSQRFKVLRRHTAISGGLVLLFLVCLFSAMPAFSQDLASTTSTGSPEFSFLSRRYLFGDWGGERSRLSEKGITFDVFYISDLQANTSGGLQQTHAGWNRIRGTIDINFDKILPWQGLTFHATGLWQTGANLGGKIGTLANPSDLVSAHTTRLDSFWLEQLFLNNKLRIRAGQLAGLDFYGNQELGGSWLIEPLGYAFGNLFSNIFESFNPAGTPGVEVRYAPTQHFYVKASVMSGNRDPYNEDPNGFDFAIRDSPNFLFETGYVVSPENGQPGEADVDYITKSAGSTSHKSYPGLYKFGGVYNGGKFANPQGIRNPGNYLIYGMASQALFRTRPGSNRGLDATVGFDYSPGDVARENVQVTAGARINGPFEGRPKDRIGIGFVYSRISDPFSHFSALVGGPLLGSEKAIELNYSIQITPYLLWVPTFQYYANVGGNSALPNAPVFGFRTKVNF